MRRQRSDFEHILVDGASTDNTMILAESYSDHFSRIVSEPDSGLYAAMNKGIALAKGEVIGILNADDFYAANDVLKAVGEVFRNPDVDACYGDLEYVSADDPSRVVRRWRSGAFGCEKFYNGWMPPHPTLFLRKSVYEKFGLYREDMGTSADYEFMLRIFLKHGLNAQYVPRVLVRMRVGGLSNRNLTARWRANRNDAKAWKTNELTPRPWTHVMKPLRKMGQWWV